jgi:hypothetical protein
VVARFSTPVQTGPGAHTTSCTMGTGSFPRVKSGRGVTLTSHLLWCRSHKRVELYLYSPHGPYGLYRASVPVQGCTLEASSPFFTNHAIIIFCWMSELVRPPYTVLYTVTVRHFYDRNMRITRINRDDEGNVGAMHH